MTVTVYFTADDVQARPNAAGGAHFTLTPSAYLAAEQAGLNPGNTLETFTDWGHARCVAAGRQAMREFDTATREHELPEAIRLVGRQAAMYVAFIVRRLAHTLPAGPWRMRDGGGDWKHAASIADALAILMPRILDFGLAHRGGGGRPPLPGLYRKLTRAIAAQLAGNQPWLLGPTRRHKLGFGKAAQQAGFRIGCLRTTAGGWSDYIHLLQALRRGDAMLRVAPATRNAPSMAVFRSALRDAGATFGDPLVRAGWQIYCPYLERNIASMLGLLADGPDIIKRLGHGITASYEANSWLGAALFEAASTANWPAVIVNHNSHPRTGRAIADFVIGTLFRSRTANSIVSHAGHWSPQEAAWRDPDNPCNTRVIRYKAAYPAAKTRSTGAPFRILHAANYQNWSDFFPWISETSDEFVKGIALLAKAAAQVSDIELIIRVRPKTEVNADVVRACIAAAPNVSISSTEEDFLDQLSGCDLLISHFSTTVEQALQMGKPVLLWGNTQRYQQFPAQFSPPTAQRRDAVYAVSDATTLPGILTAIRDHHRGKPLAPAETAPYRVPNGSPEMAGLAELLFANVAKPCNAHHG